jgi:transcriptional regulator with XRE-family HTH domain
LTGDYTLAKKRVKHVSDQLREAIDDSGEKLCQIARGCGVDDGVLSRFMRDERGLTTKTLDRLCEYLNLELRESKRKGR